MFTKNSKRSNNNFNNKINNKAKNRRTAYSRQRRNNFLYKSLESFKWLFWINNSYNIVLLIVLFLVPVYPIFASFVYNNNQYDFLRNDIDESSIIGSFYINSDVEWEWEWETPILENMDSYLSIKTILNDERDLEWTNEIIDYEVKLWDNISSIAYNFQVSTNSIYWANDFTKNHVIHPWDIIKVPPTSWLIHQVKSGDTIDSLAELYKVESETIYEQNLLALDDTINVWDVLVIPWAVKIVPKTTYTNTQKLTNTSNDSWYSFSNYAKSDYVNAWGKYKLVRRKPSHTFYWWNCTRYVAQYKNVNWWWNANQWIDNAIAKWHSTWITAELWAIIVFNGRWYNPRYWHVWIVMDIDWDDIIVSDMNYRRLNEVTYRKIPKNDRAIMWYIYVD